MSKTKSSIEQRYEAVIKAKQGVPLLQLEKQYSIARSTLQRLISRYDREGIEGLKEKASTQYPEHVKLAALREYETNGLSLSEIYDKYDIGYGTFKRWQKAYEAYKHGDKYALNGNGAIRKCDMPYRHKENTVNQSPHPMSESKEKQERRKALSKLSKKELQELLLDREAELDILKNLEALDRERENKRHEILRGLSRD